MILGKVKIQNFKSIKNTGWVFLSKGDLINILAGQNESGKTSFLRALKFFQEGGYDTFEDEDRRMEESPRIDCTFYMDDSEYSDLVKHTNKNVADYFKKHGFTFVRGNVDEDDFDKIKYMNPDSLKNIIEVYNDSLKNNNQKSENESENKEIEKFSAFEYFNSIKPKLVFYSSFVDNILPGKILYPEIPGNQAVQDFEKVYDVNFQELLSSSTTDNQRARQQRRIRREAAESLNNYWNQKISGEEVEYNFSISINPDSNPNLSYVNFLINQGDESELKISQKSQGFQWFIGFNLRLRAHEQEMDKGGLILLIDEPGQGLHEVAQEDVKNVIEELARDSKMQIIYSTHQPVLLGKEHIQFSRLLLVEKTNKNGTKFKTISQIVSSTGSRDSLAPIRSALGLISIKDLSVNRLSLVTEGITEYFYIKTFFEDKYTIIPSAGVDQVPNIFAILYGWGINSKVLLDDDTQGKKAFGKIKKEFFGGQDSSDFKTTVYKPIGFDGIENTLSKECISGILADYDKEFLDNKTKVENVEQVGKFIFAKSFFDKYSNKLNELDDSTKKEFKKFEEFLNK